MGTIWVAQRADLTPVYRMIFRRLHRRRLDWNYHFPRLYAVDLRPQIHRVQSGKVIVPIESTPVETAEDHPVDRRQVRTLRDPDRAHEIGRASCRERV